MNTKKYVFTCHLLIIFIFLLLFIIIIQTNKINNTKQTIPSQTTTPIPAPTWIAAHKLPRLRNISINNAMLVHLYFTANTKLISKYSSIAEPLTLGAITNNGTQHIQLQLHGTMHINTAYPLNLYLKSTQGAHISMTITLYAPNDNIPILRITELAPLHSIRKNGTYSRMPALSITVHSDGNLSGITLYAGIPTQHTFTFSFPAIPVFSGDIIALYFRTNAHIIAGIIQQNSTNRTIAFAFQQKSPFSLYNGIITLATSAQVYAPILDAIVWHKKEYTSKNSAHGLISKQFAKHMQYLTHHNAWMCKTNTCTYYDTLSTKSVTATQTLQRINIHDSPAWQNIWKSNTRIIPNLFAYNSS